MRNDFGLRRQCSKRTAVVIKTYVFGRFNDQILKVFRRARARVRSLLSQSPTKRILRPFAFRTGVTFVRGCSEYRGPGIKRTRLSSRDTHALLRVADGRLARDGRCAGRINI